MTAILLSGYMTGLNNSVRDAVIKMQKVGINMF